VRLIAIFPILSLMLAGTTAVLCQEGPLRAGIDGTFAPHAMPKVDGTLDGFNVDLVKELEKQLGTKIQLDSVQFSGLVPGLQSGVYDFLAAPVSANAERASSLLFTEGYVNTDFQLIVPKSGLALERLDDLKNKTIAVNKGSTYDQWARGQASTVGWKVESFGTSVDAIQAILSGKAVAMLTGSTAAAWIVKQNPAVALSLKTSTGLVFAIPVKKDNLRLRERLDLAIECLKQAGIIAQLHQKWFGIPPDPDSASVTIYPGLGVPDVAGYDPTPHPAPECKPKT
jgi:polar amino acid transport system substrate-binding protein